MVEAISNRKYQNKKERENEEHKETNRLKKKNPETTTQNSS